MKTTEMTTTQGNDQFYPTPAELAEKMVAGLDFDLIQSVLEPSGGKGNLIKALAEAVYPKRYSRHGAVDVDVCEIDPYLRQICKYNFSGEKISKLQDEKRPLADIYWQNRTETQNKKLKSLEIEIDTLESVNVHIVHDDFLTYRTFKHYDLILMNPPFKNGDTHLLRAIEMQKRGGSIICLLNAETLLNPYTSTREVLKKKLDELGADIEFISDAFKSAERRADVDVAIIKIHIEPTIEDSIIWQRMKKAVEAESTPDPELQALVTGDYIEQAIQLYNCEVAATLELVQQYIALEPYMMSSVNPKDTFGREPILILTMDKNRYPDAFNVNKYMRTVRLKYWRALFTNEKFIGKLTSKLREQYQDNISRMADYEFSAFNIKQVVVEMNASMMSGVEAAIMELFDKLTIEHSWYPECADNRHYFNGWATNKAHKIGKKCIIPTYGMFSSYSWDKQTFNVSEAYSVISDIEKAFNYLDGNRTAEYSLDSALNFANSAGKTRNIQCKYFAVDLFKKGTTHIKFYPESMPLVERLNIYASQHKGWLPPNYGRTSYGKMNAKEKAVVDSFHGDGSDGSGEEAYSEVIANASYYLAEPAQTAPLLGAGA